MVINSGRPIFSEFRGGHSAASLNCTAWKVHDRLTHRSMVDSEPNPLLPKSDRRCEERRPASGQVVMRFSNPAPLSISGSLLDISNSGFRAAHEYHGLETG